MPKQKNKKEHKKNNLQKKFFPIVGIGASAGGLEAASQLLEALPKDIGMGFVLVQHLDPTHESILADLLSKVAAIPVTEAKDKIQVKPNNVYVIPHNKDMTIINGVLQLTTRKKEEKLHMPIDDFFNSLAESQKEMAIGVILSGTASDGTLGLKSIKYEGGITFAQDKTAKHQGMPKAAIASGNVDRVLSPSKIAEELAKMSEHPYLQEEISSSPEQKLSKDTNELTKIFSMLNKSSGIDFRHYKEATIQRRIKRRMLIHKIKSLRDYIKYLNENSAEIAMLHDDLLINVTSFFREPQTFQFLYKTIFPRLIKNKSQKDPIRIWIPGCATGEEVYSIAISISEFCAEKSINNSIQIFGTDVSKSAIEKARAGLYSQKDVANISPERLTNYFEKVNGAYQISKSIRELCIFAPHNVFGDPPFSKLDLISCCNVLIYLDLSLQEKILRAFHFALKSGGYLMLGTSEAVSSHPGLFTQIEKKYKIYTRKDSAPRGIVAFGTIRPKPERQHTMNTSDMTAEAMDPVDIQKEADTILLSRHTPASVVINSNFEIIQFRGSTGKYLEPPQGKPSFNLIKMAKEGLGFELRSAISKVIKNGKPFTKEYIPICQSSKKRDVTIQVIPLKSASTEPHYLVLFEESTEISTTRSPNESRKNGSTRSIRGSKDRKIAELEQELNQTREDMRAVTEEQEATNEELQTASEEILSSNEELQSINEELETSKEELESTNEELITVNEELLNRNEQLLEARDYAEAIIRTVQVPLLILDRDLRVRTGNRSFQQMFQVTEAEISGKFIYDLGNGQWDIPALRKLLHDILPKNNVFDNYEIEHTFPLIGHKIMLLNARKFIKDGENILLAIENITDRKGIEKQKDLFIGIASHELKTPITAMKGYAQLLEKRLSQHGESEDIELIHNINKQTNRMTNLINDLLNTSKIQAGKLILEKEKFDLNALISKTAKDLSYITETHQIITKGEIQDNVYGDKIRVEQVLVNLISNAVKYSPKADRVIVTLANYTENAIVSIQDFGFGIPEKDREKIFERFYRTSDKKKMNVTGFGLGLYIAAEIVKGHHGRIWVESEEDKGSTFYFTIPFLKAV